MKLDKAAIADATQGQEDGAQFIRDLRKLHCDQDALYDRVLRLSNSSTTPRSFCRELQEFVERGA